MITQMPQVPCRSKLQSTMDRAGGTGLYRFWRRCDIRMQFYAYSHVPHVSNHPKVIIKHKEKLPRTTLVSTYRYDA